jgi:hypothetical protein
MSQIYLALATARQNDLLREAARQRLVVEARHAEQSCAGQLRTRCHWVPIRLRPQFG